MAQQTTARNSPGGPGRRALTTIFMTVLLDLLGFGMLLPLLPFYARDLGATPFAVGALFASYSLAQLVFAPLAGRLSDRFGRRPVLLATLGLSAASHLAFAAAGSLVTLLLARTASGIAASNLSVAQAYIADVTSAEKRSQGMGMIGAAFGLGLVLGPALGGLLGLLGHVAVPLGAAVLAAADLVLTAAWLPEPERTRQRQETPRSGLLGRVAPAGLGLMVLFFVVTFGFSMMEATLALYCQDVFGFGHLKTTWLFGFIGVVMVVVQGGLGALVRRFGERALVPAGIALMAAGLVYLPWAGNVPLLAAAGVVLAVGAGLHNPASFGLLSRLTAAGHQGGVLGLARSFGSLARVLGPLAGTWLFGRLGAAWPFWLAGALMAGALPPALVLMGRLPATKPGSSP